MPEQLPELVHRGVDELARPEVKGRGCGAAEAGGQDLLSDLSIPDARLDHFTR